MDVGLNGDNLLLQDILEEHMKNLNCLWIIGGDFNIESQALQTFAARLGGVLIYPKGHTCYAGRGSTIDYFIVHRALKDLVRAEAMPTTGVKTHYPVRLPINAEAREMMQATLRPPRHFGEAPVRVCEEAAGHSEGEFPGGTPRHVVRSGGRRPLWDLRRGFGVQGESGNADRQRAGH